MLRKVVRIDETRCDGCGECISSCAEGAIALVGGKAKLVSDVYCDGLGACLGECPQDAITVEEREAEGFDEVAVGEHLERLGRAPLPHAPLNAALALHAPAASRVVDGHAHGAHGQAQGHAHAGCPGSAPRQLPRPSLSVLKDAPGPAPAPAPRQGGSTLAHWPVQLKLVPPGAPWLAGADLLVAADCVPFAYASFHADFLAGKKLLVGCPKLDDNQAYAAKLGDILARNEIRSVTVVRMEVPCCGGISWAAREGLARSGKDVPLHDVVIGVDGGVRQS
jgi:Pyruvate/2-oxoacid:ferredoxin oxidoreductase delta subunit